VSSPTTEGPASCQANAGHDWTVFVIRDNQQFVSVQ